METILCMEASQGIIELFDSEGVEQVFTLMSDGIMGLVSDAIEEENIDVVQTRHEQPAVAMADGYSRANGDIGVSLIGRGAALAQTGTALGTAVNRGSDVLILAAEYSHSTPDDSLQHKPKIKKFDQHGFLRNILGEEHVVDIRSEDAVIPDLEEVFRRLRVGEGPIAVQIPHDVLGRDIDISESNGGKGDAALKNNGPTIRPPDGKIEEAIEHYLDSDATRPPIVLAGRGAAESGAKDAIEAFAEQTNGLLATSIKGRGLFSDHPYSLGFVGSWGSNIANRYITDSDCIFAFGCSLNSYTLDSGHLLPDEATVVHVDTDESSIGRYAPVDVGIVGDARETAEMLLAELEAMNIDRSGVFWTDSLRREISEAPDFEEREYPERDGTLDPRTLVRRLNEILPAKRFIVSDGGHSMRWTIDGLDITHPDDYTWTIDFAGIGQAMSQGIGASMSLDDDRTCITSCGDAGFFMHLSEVETAARNDAPVIIVVWNDDAFGEEYHNLIDVGLDPNGAVLPTPDLSGVAEKLGADGYRISSEPDLEAISDEINKKPDGPVILDCRIDVDIRHRTAGL
jgi:acetolactate synthase-1/2/3 large subunit